MRRTDREITDRGLIEEILAEGEICRLGLWDGKSVYVVPVNFAYCRLDNSIIFHSSSSGRKIDVLKKNPSVSFEIDIYEGVEPASSPCGYSSLYRSAEGEGKAEFITSLEEKTRCLNILMKKYAGKEFSFPREALAKTAVIRISIEKLTAKGRISGNAAAPGQKTEEKYETTF